MENLILQLLFNMLEFRQLTWLSVKVTTNNTFDVTKALLTMIASEKNRKNGIA